MSNGASLVKRAYVSLFREVGDSECYRAALEARRPCGHNAAPGGFGLIARIGRAT